MRTPNARSHFVRWALTAVVLVAPHALAREGDPTPPPGAGPQTGPQTGPQIGPQTVPPTIDPQAERVLIKLRELYGRAKSISGRTQSAFVVTSPGRTQEYTASYEFQFARPMRFATFRAAGEPGPGCELTCDGERLVTYCMRTSRFVLEPAPPSLTRLMQRASRTVEVAGSPSAGLEMLVMQALFQDDPAQALMTRSTQVEYHGEESIGERPAHRIRFVEQNGHVDIWIDAGERPWIVQAMPKEPASPSELIQMRLVLRFDKWSTEPAKPERFEFSPPAGAYEVVTLPEVFGQQPPEDGPGEKRDDPPPLSLRPQVP